MIGLLAMGIVHMATDASTSFSNWVLMVGKLWIPNAQGIGPYSGKETFLLIGWLLSWAVLHLLLRKRDMKLAAPVVVFVVGMALATLLIYTPFIDFILGK
jgi:hypothetical protein